MKKVNANSLANLKPKSAEWLREHRTHLNKPHTEASKKLISQNRKGKLLNEENHKWKGDSVGYVALHSWIYRRLGKASFCSNDLTHESKRFNWANISGEYKRDLNDWKSLCQSCHYEFDNISEKRWKNHIKNENKICFYGDSRVHAKGLCGKHYLKEWRDNNLYA